jgi:hypothetical protein
VFRQIKRIALATALVAGVTAGTTGLVAGSAAASGCGTRSTFKAFAPWGDQNDYFVTPGGTFEGSMSGWAFYAGNGSPSVVNDQAPWRINGSTHSKALNLPAYSTAQVPNMCIASNEEWMRLFYKDPGVSGSQLLVKVEAWSSAGRRAVEFRINAGGAGWKVSPQIALPNMRDQFGNQMVTITMTSVGTAASWRVDDVMVDPWKTR